MKCPNCHNTLETAVFDGIEINHCSVCGGTFFDSNEINRISLDTAKELAGEKRSDSLNGSEKFCPRDSNSMKPFRGESVPLHVTVIKCDKCGGAFVFADDLVEFKNAQSAKLDYFKAWRIPVPTMKSILVASFIVISSVGLLTASYLLLQRPQTVSTQAETICSRLQIVKTDEGHLAFCNSQTPLKSKAVLYCMTGEREIIVNKTVATNHSIQVPTDCSAIQFIFEDGRTRLETEIMSLTDR